MSDNKNEKDIVPDFSDFSSFLTAEDRFKLEVEKYLPEFLKRLQNDTLMQDQEFTDWTLEVQALGKEAGIDLQQYILDYGKDNGYV